VTPQEVALRPRVEGDRERQILEATLEVLADAGYDRLTMDAVASAAKASKATLYRRWTSKAALVIDAICAQKGPTTVPDTGTLRGDLIEMSCGIGGFTDPKPLSVLGSIATAMSLDPEFAETWRRDFLGPKSLASRAVYERAQARGEIRADLDLDLIAPALAGMLLHRIFLLGEQPTPGLVARLIDQIILPACHLAGEAVQPHEEKDPS
jgi:Tetracyclin repressor-like, C-terminal domain/Bacterial regulatory proteins, tetR family